MTSTGVRHQAVRTRRSAFRRLALAGVIAAVGASALASQANALSFVYASEEATLGAAPAAECPAGRKVLGGGVNGGGDFNTAETVGLRSADGPDAGIAIDDAWQGFVEAFSPITVGTYAICRNGPVVRRKKSIDFVGPGERATETVSCPRGYRVTGGGVTSPDDIEVKGTRPATRAEPGRDRS